MSARSRPEPSLEATPKSEPGRALELAYRFIARRERTESEVRSRLERAEFTASEVDAALTELIEFGVINDQRYARLFTDDRRALDAWGDDRIARVLRERGVDRNFIEAALSQDQDAGAALERATALLSERFPGGPSSDRDRHRAFGVLARKGYESELAADAVRAWARRVTH